MSGFTGGDWLDDMYGYVPIAYLPALLAINTSPPRIVTVDDQTVWHIEDYSAGYITGISATNIGFGWSYMLMVGSVTPDGTVKFSFSPLGNHDLILANGLPAEGYLDTGNRREFATGGGVTTLFADFARLIWEGHGALPLVVTGPILENLRLRLDQRRSRAA